MTSTERADKIVSKFDGMTLSGGLGTAWLKTQIAAEIEQAVDEATRARESYLTGKKVAYEEAAKIADEYNSLGHYHPEIAEEIRAKAREL